MTSPRLQAQAELLLRDISEEELRILRPAELCGLYVWGELKLFAARDTGRAADAQAWEGYTRKVFEVWAERATVRQ